MVGADDGRIASSPDERRMHACCRANGLAPVPQSPVHHDFDRISAGCRNPVAESLDAVSALNAWNLLGDARALRESEVAGDDDGAAGTADKVYAKLFHARGNSERPVRRMRDSRSSSCCDQTGSYLLPCGVTAGRLF